jgi:hypothetical protein
MTTPSISLVIEEDYNYEEEEQQVYVQGRLSLNDTEKAPVFMWYPEDYQEFCETLGIMEVNARVKMVNRIKGKFEKILNFKDCEELDFIEKAWQKDASGQRISEVEIYKCCIENHLLS